MTSEFRTDYDRNEYLLAYMEFSLLLVLALLTSIIVCIWIFAIIVKKIGIRRRKANLIKFGPGNNPYYDITNTIKELRIQSKILNFFLLMIFLEALLVMVSILSFYVQQSCLAEDFQMNNTLCNMKYGLTSPIVACRIHTFSSAILKLLILVDIAIFGIGVFYITSLIERTKSPLKSKWKHIAIITCSLISFAIIFTNQYTVLLSNTVYAILLQVLLIYVVVGGRTLYRQFTKQQRDLFHFNRPDRYKIIQSIERLKQRYKLIVFIIFVSIQISATAYDVFAIFKAIKDIFVDNCQFENIFHIRLPFNTIKSIVNNFVYYSVFLQDITLSLVVLIVILLNIIYGMQALIHYYYQSRKRVYRYNMHNLFNPKLGQPLLQDYVRANRTFTKE